MAERPTMTMTPKGKGVWEASSDAKAMPFPTILMRYKLNSFLDFWKFNFTMTPHVRLLGLVVSWSVGLSNFRKGGKLHFYLIICLKFLNCDRKFSVTMEKKRCHKL